MKTIRVGGVPEHFNLPWHLCREEGDFKAGQINLEWKDFPDGTGAMNRALRNAEIDVAVILTEGIVKDITAGNPSRIIQKYIDSPLIWGIHVAQESSFIQLHDLENTTAAISRPGSGSQLMAYVNAEREGWDTDRLKFQVVGDIDGAVEALKNDTAQYFMWEHFTTKPLVDKKVFRRVADCPTPWPCFVVAARQEFLEENEASLLKMLEVVNTRSAAIKELPAVIDTFSSRYDQKPEDIEKWLEITSWSQQQLTGEELQKVQDTLHQLKLIDEKKPASEIIYTLDQNSK